MVKQTKYKGVNQLNAIIEEIMNFQEYPKWDFLNGVLSCKEVLGEFELWLHWEQIRIVPSEKRFDGLKASDCEILEEWNTLPDGTITLIGRKD